MDLNQQALDEMTPAERLAMDEAMATDYAALSPAQTKYQARKFREALGFSENSPCFTPLVETARILEQAAVEQRARAEFYDAPNGELSMAKAVAAFNAVHSLGMTEVQGWQFMELLKMVRASQGKPRLDNFVDGCSYAALAGAAAMRTAK
jgi:hypothetical protein